MSIGFARLAQMRSDAARKTRCIRTADGWMDLPDDTATTTGLLLRDCEPGTVHTFLRSRPIEARVMRDGFNPCRDDPHETTPTPGEPVDGLHGEGGRSDS